MDQTSDYFQVRGYRKLALRLLLQTLSDMKLPPTSAENQLLIEQAVDWVKFHPEATVKAAAERTKAGHTGLTFADCFYALGYASDVEPLRQAVLNNPIQVSAALARAMDNMNSDEAVFVDLRAQKAGISVGDFNTSFLFPGQAATGG